MKTIELPDNNSPDANKELVEHLRETYEKEEICLLVHEKGERLYEAVLIPNSDSFKSIAPRLQKEEGCMWTEFKWENPELNYLLKLFSSQCAATDSYQKFIMGKYFVLIGKAFYEKLKEENKISLIKKISKNEKNTNTL